MSDKLNSLIDEAQRQVQICNACRYCEGYCAVFPAINRQRSFTQGDIIQLANLCHNCRGCYYACQYTEPHEFNINLPQSLADTRAQSWQTFIKPTWLAAIFQQSGVAVAALLFIAITFFCLGLHWLKPASGNGFYQFLSHTAMISLFIPAFIGPFVIIASALRSYWKAVNGKPVRLRQLTHAFGSTARMKNLAGGHGEGCNFENTDRFTNKRRWLHQATLYGFLLCFASTASGTVMHYVFNLEAPYSLMSLPKLLGVPGGFLLVIGCTGLAWLKIKSDPALGATNKWGGEMAFTVLLASTGATGLALYFATGTTWVPALLAIHLGTVLSLFILMPYSKMVHGFFRLAALVKDAQQLEVK